MDQRLKLFQVKPVEETLEKLFYQDSMLERGDNEPISRKKFCMTTYKTRQMTT